MTRTTYLEEEASQANRSERGSRSSGEEDQILHLKRLLVTLKQQYEKNLSHLNDQLQAEVVSRQNLQQELERANKLHEEEQTALRVQQATLKELLKKSHQELKLLREQSQKDPQEEFFDKQERLEQLEEMVPYLRDCAEDAQAEVAQLKAELKDAYQKIQFLQADLMSSQQARNSYLTDQDTESLKKTQIELKALELRYTEVINERLALDQQVKQLQLQLEQQSSVKEALEETEKVNGQLERDLQEKQALLEDSRRHCLSLQEQMGRLNELTIIQDRYELLKEELLRERDQLEEALEARVRMGNDLVKMAKQIQEQEERCADLQNQLSRLSREKETFLEEVESLKVLCEEGEARLKISQQHLAKKVKEAALLTEKVEELQATVDEHRHQLEISQSHISQLQASLEISQKQEKKLQDQLHESLRSTESQAAKWEEKYFKMYDKWQESEVKIRELKRFEEKHHQMQSLLANLGSFIGSPFHSPLLNANMDSLEKPRPHFDEMSESPLQRPELTSEEARDLFALKHVQDKFKSNLFS